MILIFRKEVMNKDDYDSVTIELKNESVTTIDDVLRTFEDFLRGCGFFFDGSIEIVKEYET